MRSKYLYLCLFMLLLLSALWLTGCEKEKENKLTPDMDIAESVAGAVGVQSGGMIDELADLCELMTIMGTSPSKDSYQSHRTYDDNTGTWTITVDHTRGVAGTIPYSHVARTYKLKLFNEYNVAQQYYVVNGDTARTVSFSILNGTGTHQTRRISQQLDSLSASITVTNANRPYVTINGEYMRAAQDTIRGFRATRISNHVLNLTFHDIVAPRGGTANFYYAISGNMTGHYTADVTFINGQGYTDTHIDREFTVDFGQGRGDITIGDDHYTANLLTGEVLF